MRFGFWEILLIVVLIFILFGSQKFPDTMKNLAEGINIFKREMKKGDEKKEDEKTESHVAPAPATPAKKPAVKKSPAKSVKKK
ncbi:MAG: twin-arginine translocase TatA/TatE family subunit [Proteobacteria bacterium]|nr:twin-arginine translocase TatA/TatE family subunit [Pseudomonadota bacterium]